MAQRVRCLLHMHEDLSLDPHVKTDAGLCVHDPRAPMTRWKAETREFPEAHGPVNLAYTMASKKKPYLKQGKMPQLL